MTPERWQQVKQIFQSALERNPAERSAFLNQACADDAALRQKWLNDEKNSDKRLIPYIPKAQLAAKLYGRLREKEQAMESLEKAFKDHDLFPDAIRTEPEFDNLRSDPRFANLLRRI